jgi:hypothetical protein
MAGRRTLIKELLQVRHDPLSLQSKGFDGNEWTHVKWNTPKTKFTPKTTFTFLTLTSKLNQNYSHECLTLPCTRLSGKMQR